METQGKVIRDQFHPAWRTSAKKFLGIPLSIKNQALDKLIQNSRRLAKEAKRRVDEKARNHLENTDRYGERVIEQKRELAKIPNNFKQLLGYSGYKDRITGIRLTPDNILRIHQERRNQPLRDLNNLLDAMTWRSEKVGKEKRREDRRER